MKVLSLNGHHVGRWPRLHVAFLLAVVRMMQRASSHFVGAEDDVADRVLYQRKFRCSRLRGQHP